MENKSHAIAAGVFVVVVAAMLLVLAMWLGRDKGSYHTYEMSTSQAVSGLQVQAAVRYKGVPVGHVTDIGFDPKHEGNVLILVDVQVGTPITAKTYATLGYQGVTGLAYINLTDANVDIPLQGKSAKGYPLLAMRPSNLSQVVDMGPELIADIRLALNRVNNLLSSDNQQELITAIHNIGEAAGNSAQLMHAFESTWKDQLNPTINKLSRDVGTSMLALQRAADGISNASAQASLALTKFNADDGALNELNKSLKAFVGTADAINDGTLPQLQRTMTNVSLAMQSLTELTAKLNNNPQALIYGDIQSRPGPGEPGYVAP